MEPKLAMDNNRRRRPQYNIIGVGGNKEKYKGGGAFEEIRKSQG